MRHCILCHWVLIHISYWLHKFSRRNKIRFWLWGHLVLLQVMNMNQTVATPTELPPTNSSTVVIGVAVGLPLAFLIVAVVITVLCIRRRRSTNISQPAEQKITEESVHNAANPRYIASTKRPPPPTQPDPVYENFQNRGPAVKPQKKQINNPGPITHRGNSQNDDLYMQCDPQEDAIYNNDPSFFKCSRQPGHSHEDEYIMPDMS